MLTFSVVVPVYNESESLPELYREILETAGSESDEFEIIFIDDGSKDPSWSIIKSLVEKDRRVHGIKFRRNFGKAAALDAGFRRASGQFIVTMDADLQDDPHEIPGFLKLMNDYDVVSGWKKIRHDPWHKVYPSRCFNAMVSLLTGVRLHDHNCGMKCYRREIFDEIRLYGELHRFIPVLAAARGWKIGEKIIQHRARIHGQSKYGFTRFIKGFLDLLTVKFITGYGQRPQHLLGTIGLLAFALGATLMILLAAVWLVTRLPFIGLTPCNLGGRPAVIYSAALMLLGAQFLMTGIIAELILSWKYRGQADYSIEQDTDQKTNQH